MRDYEVFMIPNATLVVDPDAIKELDNVLLMAAKSHSDRKEHARKTYRANGTHPRDHAATLKHNRERRGEKLYNREGRNRKRKNSAKREAQAEIELVFGNKHHGFGFVEDPELFYTAGYDAGYIDGYVDACVEETEESSESKTSMPWENIDLVLYLFDDAAKYICQCEGYAEKYATEIELMRAAFKNGVHKLTHSSIPVMADIIFPEDVLYLLLGKDGYAYLMNQSLHHLMENVAHNLYALSEQPDLHQYYLDLLQNRTANCE